MPAVPPLPPAVPPVNRGDFDLEAIFFELYTAFVNLILFDKEELGRSLPPRDPRVVHIQKILGLQAGEDFKAGILGGPLGRGQLKKSGGHGWSWTFTPEGTSPPPRPLTLLIGCPRPPVARRLLKDMTAMGIQEMFFCKTDLNERTYFDSKLWKSSRWQEALREGAAQGMTTLLPKVQRQNSVEEALEALPSQGVRLVLDRDPQARPFLSQKLSPGAGILAVGPERGWSGRERELFSQKGFTPVFLGDHCLRTETACAVGSALVLAGMGLL